MDYGQDCDTCGQAMMPDPFEAGGSIWIAYICGRCGVQHIVTPFEQRNQYSGR